MKIVTVVGARPQFIKAATVSRAINTFNQTNPDQQVTEKIVHTGQHFDPNMNDVFFRQLEIPEPHWNLGISGSNHGAMTGRMLEGIEEILESERPDWVLVYGDTNSTLAGALAAAKLNRRIAHVEAGLRSFNRTMPEEVNRIVTDQLSTLLLCPTETSMDNLRSEGFPHHVHTGYQQSLELVGDVMFDSSLFYGTRSDQTSTVMKRLGLNSQEFVLVTIHRAENTDDPATLNEIALSLEKIGRRIKVVLPIHPRTRKRFAVLGVDLSSIPGLTIIEPVDYLDMVQLEKNAAVIVTDSGGVQKEAFFFGVPCVTAREETEWTELINAGWNRLAPPKQGKLEEHVFAAIGTTGEDVSPYGDGDAAAVILRMITANTL